MTFKVGGKIDRDLGWQQIVRSPRIRWVGYRDFTLWIHSAGIHTSSRVSFITGYSNVRVAILNHWHFYPNPCIYLMNHDKEKKKNMWRIENLRYLQWFSLMEFADVYVPKAYQRKPTNDLNSISEAQRSFNILPQIFILQLPPLLRREQINAHRKSFQSSSCLLCCTELVLIKVAKSFF